MNEAMTEVKGKLLVLSRDLQQLQSVIVDMKTKKASDNLSTAWAKIKSLVYIGPDETKWRSSLATSATWIDLCALAAKAPFTAVDISQVEAHLRVLEQCIGEDIVAKQAAGKVVKQDEDYQAYHMTIADATTLVVEAKLFELFKEEDEPLRSQIVPVLKIFREKKLKEKEMLHGSMFKKAFAALAPEKKVIVG